MANPLDWQDMPIVIGDNLACAAALHKLSSDGIKVLHISGGKQLGGHFAGIEIQDKVFDLGMVLLELDFEGNEALESLDQSNFTGWTYTFSHIKKWISNTVEVQKIESPQIYVDGDLFEDYLITDQLDYFKNLDKQSLPIFDQDNDLHPKNKHMPGVYERISYQDAVKTILGHEFFNQFMYPWLKKLLYLHKDFPFLAKHHRALWLPLYYPETISSFVAQPDIRAIEEYVFHRPKFGTVASWVRQIAKQVYDSDYVLKHHHKLDDSEAMLNEIINKRDLSNIFVDCDPTKFSNFFLGEEKVIENADSVSIQLIFGTVDVFSSQSCTPCVINILDPTVKGYRLSVQMIEAINNNQHRVYFSLEISISEDQNTQIVTDEDFVSNIKKVLIQKYGKSIDNLKVLHKIKAFNTIELPSEDRVTNINRLATINSSFASRSGLSLSGSLLGYARSSMNDQIAQGLRFAKIMTNRFQK